MENFASNFMSNYRPREAVFQGQVLLPVASAVFATKYISKTKKIAAPITWQRYPRTCA